MRRTRIALVLIVLALGLGARQEPRSAARGDPERADHDRPTRPARGRCCCAPPTSIAAFTRSAVVVRWERRLLLHRARRVRPHADRRGDGRRTSPRRRSTPRRLRTCTCRAPTRTRRGGAGRAPRRWSACGWGCAASCRGRACASSRSRSCRFPRRGQRSAAFRAVADAAGPPGVSRHRRNADRPRAGGRDLRLGALAASAGRAPASSPAVVARRAREGDAGRVVAGRRRSRGAELAAHVLRGHGLNSRSRNREPVVASSTDVESTSRLGLLRRSPSFGYLFLATAGSSFGTYLAAVALVLQIRDLTGSGVWVAALLIADFLPIVVIGLLLGPLVDRLSRRWLMIASDLARFGVFAALPFVDSAEGSSSLAAVVRCCDRVLLPGCERRDAQPRAGGGAGQRELVDGDGRDARDDLGPLVGAAHARRVEPVRSRTRSTPSRSLSRPRSSPASRSGSCAPRSR